MVKWSFEGQWGAVAVAFFFGLIITSIFTRETGIVSTGFNMIGGLLFSLFVWVLGFVNENVESSRPPSPEKSLRERMDENRDDS